MLSGLERNCCLNLYTTNWEIQFCQGRRKYLTKNLLVASKHNFQFLFSISKWEATGFN